MDDTGNEDVRAALRKCLLAMRSGDVAELLATIRTVGPEEEFRTILAALKVEHLAFRQAFLEAYRIDPQERVAVHSGPSHSPDGPDGADGARITREGETARAEMSDGHVYELVCEDGDWVVDWPGETMGEGGEENPMLVAMTEILARFRGRIGEPGASGQDLVVELMTTMIPAVARALGKFKE